MSNMELGNLNYAQLMAECVERGIKISNQAKDNAGMHKAIEQLKCKVSNQSRKGATINRLHDVIANRDQQIKVMAKCMADIKPFVEQSELEVDFAIAMETNKGLTGKVEELTIANKKYQATNIQRGHKIIELTEQLTKVVTCNGFNGKVTMQISIKD